MRRGVGANAKYTDTASEVVRQLRAAPHFDHLKGRYFEALRNVSNYIEAPEWIRKILAHKNRIWFARTAHFPIYDTQVPARGRECTGGSRACPDQCSDGFCRTSTSSTFFAVHGDVWPQDAIAFTYGLKCRACGRVEAPHFPVTDESCRRMWTHSYFSEMLDDARDPTRTCLCSVCRTLAHQYCRRRRIDADDQTTILLWACGELTNKRSLLLRAS